uniref:Uncharacterized protein n=1 Tax=Candidatus Methanophaga sp. ANME-1 ERB7 TaxID=2759913 RepID=A0A7G9ZDC5_9EURY|nr:hypothetical protein DKLEMCON_00041 [Methanosarcinales archaeon ANME-1 ERB7]
MTVASFTELQKSLDLSHSVFLKLLSLILFVKILNSALRYFMWVDAVKWLPNNPKSEEKGG